MMRRFRLKPIPLAACLLAAIVLTSASGQADAGSKRHARIWQQGVSVAGVIALPEPPGLHFAAVDGSSTLVRTRRDVGFTMSTTGLEPEAPYTAWWVAFNRPKHCFVPYECGSDDFANPAAKVGVFFASGRLADKHGQATFAANTGYGVLPEGEDQVPFPELDYPIWPGAEVHIVVRAHGEALESKEDLIAQLTQFNGGCPPNACVDVQASLHRVTPWRW